MAIHRMRLALGIFFLVLATIILTRQWFLPGWGLGFDPLRMNLGGILALVFGCLNLARWYVVWSTRRARATPVQTPFQPDPSLVKPEPPNPDLDFTR
jgi:hypothetical protein